MENMSMEVDVTSSKSVRNLSAAIKKHYNGEVPSIVVHCAGIVENDKGLMGQEEDVWDRSIAVNLKGTFLVNKQMIGDMLAAGITDGSVVNLASLAAEGAPFAPDYSAGKAGVVGLSKAIGREFGRKGIRVNAVAPSFVDSPMARTGDRAERILEAYAKAAPLKRIGKVSEVADLCFFLASSMSSYITADVHYISGGMKA